MAFHVTNLFWRWIEKRAPRNVSHQLTHKNLYIFPTARGFLFCILILVLWLIGTNYQNNLVLGMAFFLVSLFVISIFHTFSNMANLDFTYQRSGEACAGESIDVLFLLKNKKGRWVHPLNAFWYRPKEKRLFSRKMFKSDNERADNIFLEYGQTDIQISVPLTVSKRGRVNIQRLCIESTFPLDIIRCWTWLTWDVSVLVYPTPVQYSSTPQFVTDSDGDGIHPVKGGEDYSSLREYVAGDTLKHIAWKTYAREKGLYTKEFSQNISTEHWLDFNSLTHLDTEQKLSDLCFWAIRLYTEGESFGLKLGSSIVKPDNSEAHLKKVLKLLSLYDSF